MNSSSGKQAAPCTEMLAEIDCGNHVHNLIEVATTSLLGGSALLGGMMATSQLMRMGSCFLRMVASVRRWLLQPGVLTVIHREPPRAAKEFAEEVLSYVEDVFGAFEKALGTNEEKRRNKKASHTSRLEDVHPCLEWTMVGARPGRRVRPDWVHEVSRRPRSRARCRILRRAFASAAWLA